MAEIGSLRLDDTPVNGQTERGITSNWAYDHNADVTKHRPVFVNRGDPSAPDFSITAFTADDAFHDLDLSAIVPAGAKAVLVWLSIVDPTVSRNVMLRPHGNVNTWNLSIVRIQTVNNWNDAQLVVPLDSNRIIEYAASTGMATGINLTVQGWFI